MNFLQWTSLSTFFLFWKKNVLERPCRYFFTLWSDDHLLRERTVRHLDSSNDSGLVRRILSLFSEVSSPSHRDRDQLVLIPFSQNWSPIFGLVPARFPEVAQHYSGACGGYARWTVVVASASVDSKRGSVCTFLNRCLIALWWLQMYVSVYLFVGNSSSATNKIRSPMAIVYPQNKIPNAVPASCKSEHRNDLSSMLLHSLYLRGGHKMRSISRTTS